MEKTFTLILGILMILGLLLGIIYVFVFIFNPTVINFKILASGWAAYLIFGKLVSKID